MSKAVYVYIICERTDSGHGPVKVGMSDNPWYRAFSLSAGNPRQLDVYRVFSLPNRKEARELERLFHVRNIDFRVHGEWFNRRPEQAAKIITQLSREILESLGFAGDELEEMLRGVIAEDMA